LVEGLGLYGSIIGEGYPFCLEKSPGLSDREMSLYGWDVNVFGKREIKMTITGASAAAM
jgi:hypothetical protein